MFGASVSALITDHKVRAAKLTNRWISGCWWDETLRRMNTWWRRSMVCSSADQFAENLRERSGADVKLSRLEGRNGIFMWKWTLEYLDRLSLHVQMKGCRQRRHSTSTCTSARRSRARNASTRSAPRKHSGSEHFRQISVDLLDALVKSHTRECRSCQDAWDESRRTASPEEAKRGIFADPDTRPLDPSGCSLDPEPKKKKTTSATDNENPADQMDEDNFRRGPATSHRLEPVDDENVSKKARVARNVLHIRGEDSVKSDVNEEAWPSCTPGSRRQTFLPTNRSRSQVGLDE